MDKTLGQIAHEAGERIGGWGRTWDLMGDSQRAEWEFLASAVAAAVKEEDAKICAQFQDGGPFADLIRASIKEGK